jgi:hypothetical protein
MVAFHQIDHLRKLLASEVSGFFPVGNHVWSTMVILLTWFLFNGFVFLSVDSTINTADQESDKFVFNHVVIEFKGNRDHP